MTINWSVVWSVLRTLLVAGGPVATLLIALGFPPVQVGQWVAIGLAVVGVASIVGPGLVGALSHTDAGKIAAAAALPDVAKIEVKPTATDGVAAAAADPAQPKVVTQDVT